MKSSRLLKYFEEYIKKIDMNNPWAKAKYFHSLKSMDIARTIASDLNIFNEEELVVIELIALFHDIGNFEEKHHNYLDNPDEDSTMASIRILFDEGLIRKITTETKYDTVIKLGIFCHNKDSLPKNIDEKTACICNIMKDVYKSEELRMVINYPYIDNRINTYPSTLVYNELVKDYSKLLQDTKDIKNSADSEGEHKTSAMMDTLIENYMLSCMEDSAHGKDHIYRVLYQALRIAKTEENVDYDEVINEYGKAEFKRNADRWDNSYSHWEKSISEMKKFAKNRNKYIIPKEINSI